jgi:biotin transport system substrate-specific component
MNASPIASTQRTRTLQAAFVVAGSALLALGAQVSVPLPLGMPPITGQTFALALVVALLGARGAALASVLYLAEGALGLPVFSPHGLPGIARFAGPSAGYLLAFPLGAYVTGVLFDRGLWSSFAGRLLAIVIGSAVVFLGGATWLTHFVGSFPKALAVGVAPYLIGDALKSLVAAGAAPFVRGSGERVPRL